MRATAVLSGSSLASIVAGLITAKVNAIALGPAGVGQYGLLLSLLGLAGMLAGFGIGTALVRVGAKSVAEGNDEATTTIWSGAWLVYWGLTLPIAAVLLTFRLPIADAIAGGARNASDVSFMAAALLFSVATGLHVALLNAHHRVGVLARFGIFAALLQTSVSVALVVTLGRAGIPYAILGSQVAGWVLARSMALRHVGRKAPAPLQRSITAAFGLMRFGGPYTLSMLAGTGVQMAIPFLVVRLFDDTHVGYVRAASTIAVTYMGFLSTALAQDYYPRLSAIAEKPQQLVRVVNQQLAVIFMMAVPLIFLAMGLSEFIIPIIYSPAFQPAVSVLEWQLIGDVFKFTSWALAFIILAKGRTSAYFLTETTGGAILLGASFLAMKAFGLDGVGIGYAMTYLIYFLVVFTVVRSMVQFTFSRSNARTFLLAATGILATKGLLIITTSPWVYAVPLVVGAVLSVRSGIAARRVWRAG